MRIKKNGRVINLTESDLRRIVKKVISEGAEEGVTISAWYPFEKARRIAMEKEGNILLYIYNEGCGPCVDFTKQLMADNYYRKKIIDNNLTLSKMVMCPQNDKSGKPTTANQFKPCNDEERRIWNSFESKYNVYGVPALMVISGDGTMISGPHMGGYEKRTIKRIFDDLGGQ